MLPSLGFSAVYGTPTELEPAYEFKAGGIDLVVAQVTDRYFQPEFLIGGTASTGRSLSYIESFMPLTLGSRDQVIAWLTFSVGAEFLPTSPVAWFDEGLKLQHLLPWVEVRRQQLADQAEHARLRLLRPYCVVERRWLRQMLNAMLRIVGSPPVPGRFEVAFDGEVLKLYGRGQVIGVPAQGDAWTARYEGDLPDLLALPRRIATDPTEVGIWCGRLEVGSTQILIQLSESAHRTS